MVTITVNGVRREIQAPDRHPAALCPAQRSRAVRAAVRLRACAVRACSVLLDGKEIRSCITPLSAAAGKEVTTLEGLPARWAKQKGLSPADAAKTLHPVQQAWIEEQTPLCGFCQNGMMIKATELLESVATPTVAEIKEAFHDLGPVGASVPLRKLHRDYRSRAARRRRRWRKEARHEPRKNTQRSRKSAPQTVQD